MKKFVSMALALTVAASMAVPAFAASEPVAPQNEPTAATESVSPCIYWTGTAKLNTTDYVNITSSNNIFPDSPLVTSDANNPGNVTIRVINEKGAPAPLSAWIRFLLLVVLTPSRVRQA